MALKAFAGQQHDAHIMSHILMGLSPIVAAMPNVAVNLQKHVFEHIKLKAEGALTPCCVLRLKRHRVERGGLKPPECISALLKLIAKIRLKVEGVVNPAEDLTEEDHVDDVVAIKPKAVEV